MIKIFHPKELYNSKLRGDLFPLLRPFIKRGVFTNEERIEMYDISSSDIKIVEVVNLPEDKKQEISANAKERVKKYFTIEQQQEKFVKFYKN